MGFVQPNNKLVDLWLSRAPATKDGWGAENRQQARDRGDGRPAERTSATSTSVDEICGTTTPHIPPRRDGALQGSSMTTTEVRKKQVWMEKRKRMMQNYGEMRSWAAPPLHQLTGAR